MSFNYTRPEEVSAKDDADDVDGNDEDDNELWWQRYIPVYVLHLYILSLSTMQAMFNAISAYLLKRDKKSVEIEELSHARINLEKFL